MKKIVTHNANFHADDVFAVASLEIYLDRLGEKYKIVRSRDQEIIDSADFVVDTGQVYDEEENRFDHHQETFHNKGYLDIPYSSFGLIWKHFGMDICENNINVWLKFRNEFVTVLDANDNGMITSQPAIKGLQPLDPETFIFSFKPPFNERTEETMYKSFLEAVAFAKGFVEREIKSMLQKEESRAEFEKVLKSKKNYLKTDSLLALILPKPMPWKDFLDMDDNDLDFVISEREEGLWMAQGVPKNRNTMELKVVKRSWAGLTNEELCEKSGVPGLTFYHKTGYLLVGKTKEAIVEALKKI
jgi:uncharacterized UPF0160 family protein